jgi:hypothetical protein
MRLLVRRLNFHVKELVYRNIGGKKVLILFVLTNLVYGFMLLVSIPRVMRFAGKVKLFDLMPTGYSVDDAGSLLEKLGPDGRNAYLYNQIPVDFIYPFLFGITYCLLIAYLLNRLKSLKAEYFYLCLLPVVAGMFDYFENLAIVNLLVSYPDFSDAAVHIAAFFTVMKSLLTTISFSVLIVAIILLVFRKISPDKVINSN